MKHESAMRKITLFFFFSRSYIVDRKYNIPIINENIR